MVKNTPPPFFFCSFIPFLTGPYQILSNLTLVPNPYSWNLNANVLYIDQPGVKKKFLIKRFSDQNYFFQGTGFSYVTNPLGYVTNELQVSIDMLNFLDTFFSKFPQYSKLPFYIVGESFGGHYVPAVKIFHFSFCFDLPFLTIKFFTKTIFPMNIQICIQIFLNSILFKILFLLSWIHHQFVQPR